MKTNLLSILLFGALSVLKSEDSTHISKSFFSINSSYKPVFCINKILESGYAYRWGFYHRTNIKITKGPFIESESAFSSIKNYDKCIDFRDSTGIYWVCLEATDHFNTKDTYCSKVVSDFKIATRKKVFTPGIDSSGNILYYDFSFETVETYQLSIYNRWGMKIFESYDKSFNWNGSVQNKGEPCPDGTYYYIFKYTLKDNDEKTMNGSITLIR